MVDLIRHYEDGYTFGQIDFRKRVVEALKENVSMFPDWSIAVTLVNELTIEDEPTDD